MTTYICHVRISALSTHMIHINLNTIYYTHVEQSPINAFYRKYYMKQKTETQLIQTIYTYVTLMCTHTHRLVHTHTNRVLILFVWEVLWEEESFRLVLKGDRIEQHAGSLGPLLGLLPLLRVCKVSGGGRGVGWNARWVVVVGVWGEMQGEWWW